jgi:Arc/MetJ family transcription regulator
MDPRHQTAVLIVRLDTDMVSMPYFICMKMTMHIEEALLKRVMAATGVTSKTKAVDLALRELDRRAELKRLAQEGLGLTAGELRRAFNPASDPDATLHCAEKSLTYGRKSRSR